jgi:hypothetical protein
MGWWSAPVETKGERRQMVILKERKDAIKRLSGSIPDGILRGQGACILFIVLMTKLHKSLMLAILSFPRNNPLIVYLFFEDE